MPRCYELSDNGHFEALTVVSPMVEDGEEKDQDRARWFAPGNIAAVADGVTTSPYSARAAELVVRHSPVLFQQEPEERLGVVVDLLFASRMEARLQGIQTPSGVSKSMQDMLLEVSREKMDNSYQTTLVTAALIHTGDHIMASILVCGDSAFFAFQPRGNLIGSSLEGSETSSKRAGTTGPVTLFRPRQELLTRVICSGRSHPKLFSRAGITHPDEWLACKPVDLDSGHPGPLTEQNGQPGLLLKRNTILLVPRFLVTPIRSDGVRDYCSVRFSKQIRTVQPGRRCEARCLFAEKGVTTAVLPDHFHTSGWECFQELFPSDTHFVLATDGFYSTFASPSDLWSWLWTNRQPLRQPDSCEELISELHKRLQARCGDDDISFIWIRPVFSQETEGEAKETMGGENRAG